MDEFSGKIYRWYTINKRDLPWRNTNDPYKIWISEIILQQTRVQQGLGYYLNFIEKFPSIEKLAHAKENEVLKIWQGLGYYSRAVNMHLSAKYIVNHLNGIFPRTYNDLLKLKGIGPYTAAAIASIAFNLPCPAVDGNIYRLLARYFGLNEAIDSSKGKKTFHELATELIPEKNAGFHNQSLMEFGALQCTPGKPDCLNCPLSNSCFAFNNNCIDKLPVKSKKKESVTRYFYYYFFEWNKFTFIEKRLADDIWKNLYQFPLLETNTELNEKDLLNWKVLSKIKDDWEVTKISNKKKHILSHRNIIARVICIRLNSPEGLSNIFIQVNKKDIFTFAVPRLIENFISELKLDE